MKTVASMGGGFGGRIEEKISGPITTNEQTVRGDTKLVMTNSNGGDVMPAITAVEYKMVQNQKDTNGGYVLSIGNGQAAEAGRIAYKEDVSATIKAAPSGGNQVPDVMCVHGSQDPISNTEHANAVNRNNGLENCVAIGVDGYNQSQTGDVSKTISSAASDYHHVPCVAIPINSMVIDAVVDMMGGKASAHVSTDDISPTLAATHNESHAFASRLSVRRLLPIETERLMGFPDNWTKIPWRGKPAEECPDAPRYKACGNSMGVNCMRWIGLGIEAVEAKHRK